MAVIASHRLRLLAPGLVFVIRMLLLVVLSQQFRFLNERSLRNLVRAPEGGEKGEHRDKINQNVNTEIRQ